MAPFHVATLMVQRELTNKRDLTLFSVIGYVCMDLGLALLVCITYTYLYV